eukprot:4794261-Lingulodinium_polyedra.AAC.1
MWHSMLVALIAQLATEGHDAYKIAEKALGSSRSTRARACGCVLTSVARRVARSCRSVLTPLRKVASGARFSRP